MRPGQQDYLIGFDGIGSPSRYQIGTSAQVQQTRDDSNAQAAAIQRQAEANALLNRYNSGLKIAAIQADPEALPATQALASRIQQGRDIPAELAGLSELIDS